MYLPPNNNKLTINLLKLSLTLLRKFLYYKIVLNVPSCFSVYVNGNLLA